MGDAAGIRWQGHGCGGVSDSVNGPIVIHDDLTCYQCR
jgi:hypothetical protein